MSRWIARLIVRSSAWLAPRDTRARWREEWLGELENDPRSHFALSAPLDALVMRVRGWSFRAIRAGWRGDVVQTARILQREPWHAVAVALCLAVGITATVTTFSVLNGVLYGEIPGVRNRATLWQLTAREHGTNSVTLIAFPWRDFGTLESHPPPGLAITATSNIRSRAGRVPLAVRVDDDAIPILGQFVAGNFFDVVGTAPALGRLIAPGDSHSSSPVAVISYRFWQRYFKGSRDLIGSTVIVSGQQVRIIGVAPERFAGGVPREPDEGAAPELWLPLPTSLLWPGDAAKHLMILVRPLDRTSREAAQASLSSWVNQLPLRSGIQSMTPALREIGRQFDANSQQLAMMFAVVLAAPLTVVLIGCANVANLRLARATARARELAVRLSLGATRAQLIRLLLIEASAVSIIATLAGWSGTHLLIALTAPAIENVLPAVPVVDLRVLAFAGVLTFFIVLVCGLGPAMLATSRLVARGLQHSPQAGGQLHGRWRSGLVVAQVALSFALVVIAAMLSRSLLALVGAAPPSADELLIATVDPARLNVDWPESVRLAETLEHRLDADDRVRVAGIADVALFESGGGLFRRPGQSDEEMRTTDAVRVSPNWFHAMGLSATAGRIFTPNDQRAPIAIINETLARMLTADGSPIGLSLELRRYSFAGIPQTTASIVGVVTNAPLAPGRHRPWPTIYLPYAAPPTGTTAAPVPFSLYVRTADADHLKGDMRRLITTVEPRAPWTKIDTALDIVVQRTAPERLVAGSIGGLGLTALLLAATGLYAVMTYVVSLRTREIGVRMAIGANAADVVSLIFRQALRLASAGIAIGLVLATGTAFALRGALFGVSFVDPLSVLPALALLVVVTLAAAVLPARRAAAVDPVKALRAE